MSETRPPGSAAPANPLPSRRDLLRIGGLGAASLGLGNLLAACGVSGTKRTTAEGTPSPLPSKAGELVIASWPLYIDTDEETKKRPSVEQFQRETGIKVTYKEIIKDNVDFFGTIREALTRGQPTGWDIYVISDWLVSKQVRLGQLEQIHLDAVPNFSANAGAVFKNPPYDPKNKHSIPWQAGLTGIAYNTKLAKREITSFDDLFDPAFKGKVGMFTEMRDTVNLALLGNGVDISKATIADVEKVKQRLLKQKQDGIVRAYYGQEYVDALARGDIWLTMAWAGDVVQLTLDNPNLKFVIPEEGGIIWVDNMVIPKGAAHPTDAHEWMNFVYRPEIAAQIAAYVNFVTPVPKTQELLRRQAATAATAEDRDFLNSIVASPLVYPATDSSSRLHFYKNLSEEEEAEWNRLFQEVTT